ncbi:CPBP family intramembrane glutamic endopeptidase [Chroogloeocystis siderophila]|uniref:Abortive phage infection protein n=1 Tax=Chroogloeocystis siderophila 5.2 s.c.1 TaxID=247279 RepID=A0A1U7HZ04_9CHRO|nr:type II CAAX endopeptidase family protein [Chroogloeocystis siderophila]OKH28862.1 abortive phage infection protein [Chroogloeocystis siderophila 5.2 s.c.1]
MWHKISSIARYPVFVRLGFFILVLLLMWLPVAIPIYLLGRDPNTVSILTMLLLYGEFIFLLRWWGKRVYHQRQILQHYGLVRTRRNWLELLRGLVSGVILVFSLFLVEGWLGWLVWLPTTGFLPQIILEGLIVAIAVGFAEELLFRGWLLDELERDYRPAVALWMNAILFALLHFIKPLPEILRTLPQFPALIVLGLALVWAKRLRNRLGLPIGLHAGLIWGYYIINVGQLTQYSGQVPDWITGVDRNPLAGVMGLLFLAILALGIRQRLNFLVSGKQAK